MTSMRMTMGRRAYPSDLTDEHWAILETNIPLPSLQGRPPIIERREIVNAILYVLRSGCPWRLLPSEFPAWQTVYSSFRRWQREGVWDRVLKALRMEVRQKQGRNAEPSAAIIDSQIDDVLETRRQVNFQSVMAGELIEDVDRQC